MPGPYDPKGEPRQATGERRDPKTQFLARLRDLGATDDELAQVDDGWDDLEPDGTPDDEYGRPAFTRQYRDQLLAAGDRELTQLLHDARVEHATGTMSDEDRQLAERDQAYRQAVAEAYERIGGNVDSILAWVGDDPQRAQAVHHLETGPDGAARKTLVGPLEDLLAEHAATADEDPAAAATGAEDGQDGTDPQGDGSDAATGDAATDPAIPEPAPATPRPNDDTGTR